MSLITEQALTDTFNAYANDHDELDQLKAVMSEAAAQFRQAEQCILAGLQETPGPITASPYRAFAKALSFVRFGLTAFDDLDTDTVDRNRSALCARLEQYHATAHNQIADGRFADWQETITEMISTLQPPVCSVCDDNTGFIGHDGGDEPCPRCNPRRPLDLSQLDDVQF